MNLKQLKLTRITDERGKCSDLFAAHKPLSGKKKGKKKEICLE